MTKRILGLGRKADLIDEFAFDECGHIGVVDQLGQQIDVEARADHGRRIQGVFTPQRGQWVLIGGDNLSV
jgi:hypothetical protein